MDNIMLKSLLTAALIALCACAPDQGAPTAQEAFTEASPWDTVEINGTLYRRIAAKPTETAQGDLLITIPIQWEPSAGGGIRFSDTVQIAGRTYTADCNQGGQDDPVAESVDVGNTIDTATDLFLGMPEEGTAGVLGIAETVTDVFYIEEPGDEDFFRIQIPRTVEMAITTISALDTQGWLYDSSGQELIYNDDDEAMAAAGFSYNFFIGVEIKPGTYYLRVAGHENTKGPYQIYAVIGNATDKAGKPVVADLISAIRGDNK